MCIRDRNEYLKNFKSSDARQKESKEIVVSFALYNSGRKETRNLDPQRKYLRGNFNQITSVKKKRDFVKGLKEIVDYKSRFWFEYTPKNKHLSDETLLCLSFLKDMKNSLSIPILARFYFESNKTGNNKLFEGAVKALTAYIAIRRAATGGTASIDSDLRAIMSIGRRIKENGSIPLCKGINTSNNILRLEEFQTYLKEWLEKKKIEIVSKQKWINKVSQVPIYTSSAPLTRFILLAAYDSTRVSDNGILNRSRNSMETDYFDLKSWNRKEFATIEHVAPDSMAWNKGWDEKIYDQQFIRHSLGNLVLLPKPENEIIANKNWSSKKEFYKAFSAETLEEVNQIEKDGKKIGLVISNRGKQVLMKNEHLPMIKSIVSVKDWNAKLISDRSEMLAGLAWEKLAPWLGI